MMLGNSIFYLLKGENRLSPTKSSGVELRMWCSACPPKKFLDVWESRSLSLSLRSSVEAIERVQ